MLSVVIICWAVQWDYKYPSLCLNVLCSSKIAANQSVFLFITTSARRKKLGITVL
jgi:hypothetical protein